MAKVNYLELDDDGFIEERTRFRVRKAIRNQPCPCCCKDNRLTDAEYDAGRVCSDCRGSDW